MTAHPHHHVLASSTENDELVSPKGAGVPREGVPREGVPREGVPREGVPREIQGGLVLSMRPGPPQRTRRLKLPAAVLGSLVVHGILAVAALLVSTGPKEPTALASAPETMAWVAPEALIDVEPAETLPSEPEVPAPEKLESTTVVTRVVGAPPPPSFVPEPDVPRDPQERSMENLEAPTTAAATDDEPVDEKAGSLEEDDSPYDDLGGAPVVALDGDKGQGTDFTVRSGRGSGRGIGGPAKRTAKKKAPAVYAVSGVDTPPVAIVNTRPRYPRSAQRRRIEGWARVALLIDAVGRVSQARVVATKGHTAFGDAVLASVDSWRFKPATVAGRPVSVWANRTVSFAMPRQR